jgi:phosphatidylethanolamine-binding protein (PEBP) family uncharacterized protein
VTVLWGSIEQGDDMRTNLLTPALAALCLAFAATGSHAADIFSLKSTTFEDGKLMPKKVANSKANQPNNPNCIGDNVSPQFSWENPPDGTKSFVMMMFDPESRAPTGVSHWVAYGIRQFFRQVCSCQVFACQVFAFHVSFRHE